MIKGAQRNRCKIYCNTSLFSITSNANVEKRILQFNMDICYSSFFDGSASKQDRSCRIELYIICAELHM